MNLIIPLYGTNHNYQAICKSNNSNRNSSSNINNKIRRIRIGGLSNISISGIYFSGFAITEMKNN